MYRNHRETRPLFGEAEIRTRDGRSREGTLTTAPPFYIDHRTVRLVVKRRAPFHRTRDRHVIGEHMLQGVQTEALRSPVGMLKLNHSRSFLFCIFSFFLKNHASLRSQCCGALLLHIWKDYSFKTSKNKSKTGALNENNYR